jgi:hypothetical protein
MEHGGHATLEPVMKKLIAVFLDLSKPRLSSMNVCGLIAQSTGAVG